MPIAYQRVMELIKKNNMSVDELEKKLGFGHATIRKWEKAVPTVGKLKQVADYFGVTVDFLIRGSS